MAFTAAGFAAESRPAQETAQWVVVTAPALRSAVEPLCEYRRQQGLHVSVINTDDLLKPATMPEGNSSPLRDRVRQICKAWAGPSYVLLVGTATSEDIDAPGNCLVPALRGTIGRMDGEPTDNWYGCLDEKVLPAVAVGRFPARTVAEAAAMVEKTLAWERDRKPGAWKRRFNILAGMPSYNPLADAAIERLAMVTIDAVSPVWSAKAIYFNPNSPYHLPETALRKKTTQYLTEGAAVTIYMGHSGPDGFWWREFGFGDNTLINRSFWKEINIAHGNGIFASFGCYGCQLGGPAGEGYSVYAMRNQHGPVAVIGSHARDWATMAMLMCEGLLRNMPSPGESPRLGELWLTMKRNLAEAHTDPVLYHVLDTVDGDPKTPPDVQRLEHQEMFILLGDPAIRIPAMGGKVTLKVEGSTKPGGQLLVNAQVSEDLTGGNGRLTLERPRTSKPVNLETMPADVDSDDRDIIIRVNHDRANQLVLAEKPVKLDRRDLQTTLELPANLPWPKLHIRLYVETQDSEGLAVRTVEVAKTR